MFWLLMWMPDTNGFVHQVDKFLMEPFKGGVHQGVPLEWLHEELVHLIESMALASATRNSYCCLLCSLYPIKNILKLYFCFWKVCWHELQFNLDLVTLLVSSKTVIKSHNITKSNDFFSKLKNGLCKIVTKSQVVT